MSLLQLVEQLSAIPGPSGHEELIREEILTLIKDHCDARVDALGNILAHKKGKKPATQKIQISAHMDEVGFTITHIGEDGFLKFDTLGGIDSRVILGKPVQVGRGAIPGVIGSKAVHHQTEEERKKPLTVDRLAIDIGASSKEEASALVSPGDFAIYRAPYLRMGEHKILGPAFDDRAGCAILVDLIRTELPYDCDFSFTVLEEVGLVGGATAAYQMRPDISIAVETTTASDLPSTPADKAICTQGLGPVISFMDKGTVYDQELYRTALKVAEREKIPCQPKQGVYGANEARSLQSAGAGSRAMAVSMPCRYIHSPSNMLDIRDIEPTRNLLLALIGELAGQ